MSYVKTIWADNQTPLSAENLNHIEDGIEQNSQDIDDSPFIKSFGRDSFVQKTVNLPDDVDSHGNPIDRTNYAYGAFSGAFGSRNLVDEYSSETITSGGKNKVYSTEDASIYGYDNTVDHSHQSIVGGYHNNIKASESAIFGDNNEVNGNISSGKTDTRKILVSGMSNSVGHGSQHDIIYGEHNTAGANLRHSIIGGSYNIVGDNAEAVNVFGGGNTFSNEIKSHNSDITIFGYSNTVYGGSSASNRKGDDYILGHNNKVQDPNNANRGLYDVYMVGDGLNSRHAHQVLLGEYNACDSSENTDVLSVGTGTSESNRRTSFGVGYTDSEHYIRVGETKLTQSKLIALLALVG